jgi:hypothetical protein
MQNVILLAIPCGILRHSWRPAASPKVTWWQAEAEAAIIISSNRNSSSKQ